MTSPTYDVVAIGNAIVDILAQAEDSFIEEIGVAKGSMQLMFSPEEADALYAKMGPGREVSGGSASNTVAGIAALGGKTAFIGQVADDQLGAVFAHDLRAAGVSFDTAVRPGQPTTARCLIFVTPDGQRTMNTFLGASQFLPEAALDEKVIADGAILYLEGYLWDPEEPRAAMRKAIEIARANGRKVAFTLSDVFCISRHGDDFRKLIADGLIDILFANESELLALCAHESFEAAVEHIHGKVPLLVVTRSEKGAMALQGSERVEVGAEPIDKLVDTTGAGDMFAAGFLFGQAQGKGLEELLRLGAICAAEIIQHYGARAEVDLKKLAAERLG
ncbi:adenosine kinase [Sphingomonas sp. MMS12-HWE2-04]|uniref:adenosine kinase n=1 Tax=Sphingomonas sp. MMS12-HWE2-04 TaxID=3234199 RepID=UPI00384AB31F